MAMQSKSTKPRKAPKLSSHAEVNEAAIEDFSSEPIVRHGIWAYNSQEIPARHSARRPGITMSISFEDLQDAEDRDADASLPKITFLTSQSTEVTKSLQARMLSHCNRTTMYQTASTDLEIPWIQYEDFEDSKAQDTGKHVADIIDSAGFFELTKDFPAFVDTIAVDSTFPRAQCPDEDIVPMPTVEYTQQYPYWHKYAIFIQGYTNENAIRDLPYSHGLWQIS